MIEFVQGTVEELTPTQAVILTRGGVGYMMGISLYTYSALQKMGSEEVVRLYASESIREDAYNLFGFIDRQERELFLLLTSVPGIGGASARMILSSFSPNELVEIVSTGNESMLKKVKGIGLKTAQRIIVDLHDKIAKGVAENSAQGVSMQQGLQAGKVAEESVTALTTLGFQMAASQKAVAAILKENASLSVEQVIREALKRI